MKGQGISRIIACCAVTCLLMTALGLRADVVGSISGTITDRSGAALPNATVELKNADTGYDRQTTVNSAGFYEFPSVPIGDHYQLEIKADRLQATEPAGYKATCQSELPGRLPARGGRGFADRECGRAAGPGGNGQ